MKKNIKFIIFGIISGIINGFFGAGAGLVLIPLMTQVGKLDAKKAHATTLSCVLFMCICGSFVYFANNVIDFKLILMCSIGSIIGSFIGTKLLSKLKNNIIDLMFSLVLIAAGICMIIL